MIKSLVRFWGEEREASGMPIPYNCYFVMASPWQTPGSGIASIVQISVNEPLVERNFLVEKGGERAAYDKAVNTFKLLPYNVGLRLSLAED